jgi:hypothetical protein
MGPAHFFYSERLMIYSAMSAPHTRLTTAFALAHSSKVLPTHIRSIGVNTFARRSWVSDETI